MRQKELVVKMDAIEILDWLAYDMLNDKEFKDRMLKEVNLESQKNQTAEQERNLVMQMFTKLGLKK